MASANIIKILLVLLVAPAVLAVVCTLIYMPFYRKKINSRLSQFGELDEKERKPLTSPMKIFLTFLIMTICGAVVGLIMRYAVMNRKMPITISDVERPEFMMQARDLPSLLDRYEPGEQLPGYTLQETKKENDIEIYFYANREVEYSGFPDGLIAVKYTGSDEQYLGVTADMQQTGARKLDYTGNTRFYSYEVPLKWLTFDVYNFFGKLDITVFTMKQAEAPWQQKSEVATGKETKMHLELDKEFHIEGWYETDTENG